MAQPLSAEALERLINEVRRSFDLPRQDSVALAKALLDYLSIVSRRPDQAVAYAHVLSGLASSSRSVVGAPSVAQEERAAWAALGADFEDVHGALEAQVEAFIALNRLLDSSIVGDAEMAEYLDADREQVSQLLADRRLYAVRQDGVRYFPRWQFAGNTTIHGLREVLIALDEDLHPLTVTHFFLTPTDDLEVDDEPRSPRDWLRSGGPVETVVELASAT